MASASACGRVSCGVFIGDVRSCTTGGDDVVLPDLGILGPFFFRKRKPLSCPFRFKAASGQAADQGLTRLTRKSWWPVARIKSANFQMQVPGVRDSRDGGRQRGHSAAAPVHTSSTRPASGYALSPKHLDRHSLLS